MPKPLLLARPSGVYARFLVPKDVRALVGSRFLVRPLHAPFGDVARLVAARMGMALSQAFQALRQGQAVDIDEVLRRVRRNGVQQLILKGITFPNGAGVTEVEIKTPEDMAFWRETLEKMASADPVESIGLLPEHFLLKQQEAHAKMEATGRSVGLSLSKAIENHLTDLTNAKLQPKTVLESRHTLRLFAGVVGGRSACVRAFARSRARVLQRNSMVVFECIQAACLPRNAGAGGDGPGKGQR